MSSASFGPKIGKDGLSQDTIAKVAAECNCDENRALELLNKVKNDPIRAINFHKLLASRTGGKIPRRSGISTPATPKSVLGSDHNDSLFLPPTEGFYLGGHQESGDLSSLSLGSNVSSQADAGDFSSAGAVDAAQTPQTQSEGEHNHKSHRSDASIDVGNIASQNRHEPLTLQGIDGFEKEKPEWDFRLPYIEKPVSLGNQNGMEADGSFNLRELVGAMQNGASEDIMHDYLSRYDLTTVRRSINGEVEGIPAMFYVVERNKESILRMWVGHGGDVRAVHNASGVPLLAFAIMHGDTLQADTTPITTTLLSLGASTEVIPTAFYSPFLHDLPEDGPNDDDLGDVAEPLKNWCKGAARKKLTRAASLPQRYYLDKSIRTPKPSIRQSQIAKRRNAEPLLGISSFLIGQTSASNTLLHKLLSHLTVPSKKPLVLCFAGPSGHGKTELARRLGFLLSLELEVVDCTTFSREIELFGPRAPYVGSEEGSALNNFLAKNSGQRCIVFMDEFEKTTTDVHKALLLPFDSGEYQDRRHQSKVDCSKTIWILATNAHDAIIQDFATVNARGLHGTNQAEKEKQIKSLAKLVKEDFMRHHGSPVTGRVSAFIPFLPFSVGEQAVIVHKYLLELGRDVRSAVDLSEGPDEKLLGNVRLHIRRDASVCKRLAEDEYHVDLGARSLITAVDTIKTLLVEAYLSVDEEITEADTTSDFTIDVSAGEIVARMVRSHLHPT